MVVVAIRILHGYVLGNHIAWALRLQAGPRIKARYKSQGMWFILLLFFLSHISIAKFSLLFRSLPCSSPSAYGPAFLSVSLLVASPSSAVCPRIGSRAVLEVSALNPCERDKPNLPCCMQLVLLSIQRSFRLQMRRQTVRRPFLRSRRGLSPRPASTQPCPFRASRRGRTYLRLSLQRGLQGELGTEAAASAGGRRA